MTVYRWRGASDQARKGPLRDRQLVEIRLVGVLPAGGIGVGKTREGTRWWLRCPFAKDAIHCSVCRGAAKSGHFAMLPCSAMTMQRVGTDHHQTYLCGYAVSGISLYAVGAAPALWHWLWWLDLGNLSHGRGWSSSPATLFSKERERAAGVQSVCFRRVAKKRPRRVPLESCPLQLTSLLISNNHVGTFLRFSIPNPPFPTTAATPFATVYQFCSSLPSISRQRFSSQSHRQLHSAAPSVVRTSLLSRGRPNSTPVPLFLATAMPPKAGRKRSSVGAAQRSGVQRMFAFPFSLARSN